MSHDKELFFQWLSDPLHHLYIDEDHNLYNYLCAKDNMVTYTEYLYKALHMCVDAMDEYGMLDDIGIMQDLDVVTEWLVEAVDNGIAKISVMDKAEFESLRINS